MPEERVVGPDQPAEVEFVRIDVDEQRVAGAVADRLVPVQTAELGDAPRLHRRLEHLRRAREDLAGAPGERLVGVQASPTHLDDRLEGDPDVSVIDHRVDGTDAIGGVQLGHGLGPQSSGSRPVRRTNASA